MGWEKEKEGEREKVRGKIQGDSHCVHKLDSTFIRNVKVHCM